MCVDFCPVRIQVELGTATVKHFWRIGFRLFHGKWLKCMSGPKNTGTLTTVQTDKGLFSPADAKIKNEGPMII